MHIRLPSLTTAATAALLVSAVWAQAAPDPRGVWIDRTGRGAVEITDCDGALCGRVVWLKDTENNEACGIQILGNVRPAGSGVWDRGWIYDPEEDAKYSVELKPIGDDKLRVLGYLGTKLFSETMVWQRAPDNLERCTSDAATTALAPADPGPANAPETTSPGPAPSPDGPAKSVKKEADKAAPLESPSMQSRENENSGKTARSTKSQQCKIELPYVTVSFPCPD